MKMDINIPNAFKKCYTYKNETHDITATKDVHHKLQNDPKFRKFIFHNLYGSGPKVSSMEISSAMESPALRKPW